MTQWDLFGDWVLFSDLSIWQWRAHFEYVMAEDRYVAKSVFHSFVGHLSSLGLALVMVRSMVFAWSPANGVVNVNEL